MQLLKTRFDPNDWRNIKKSAEGLCQVPLTTDRGKRVGSREYVQTVAKICPENLTVKLNALVTRVILDDENRAIGVEYIEGKRLYRADRNAAETVGRGSKSRALASREVILSGGAFNTPQLLMLSLTAMESEVKAVSPR
ncbi:GMC family oxidoreductase N-terminal domain-containing protein [Thiolapillus sp.]|uniref:GMC family oxidoreductase N-terminal domain-containing protein n=1 Tax=Thiolapillus sp. TaxID=2017437 RepID=UPI003AF9FAAB